MFYRKRLAMEEDSGSRRKTSEVELELVQVRFALPRGIANTYK